MVQANTTLGNEGEACVKSIENIAKAYRLQHGQYEHLLNQVTERFPDTHDSVNNNSKMAFDPSPSYTRTSALTTSFEPTSTAQQNSLVGTNNEGIPLEYQHDPDLWYAIQASMGIDQPVGQGNYSNQASPLAEQEKY